MSMILHRLFDDPTEGRIINSRFFNGLIMLVLQAEIGNEEKQKLLHLLTLISKKLIGIRLHADRYKRHQATEIDRVKIEEASRQVNLSDELFLEFDGFLVQIKSTLDYLVKVPLFVIGPKHWSLRTFGDKGENVVKSLGNLPKELKSRTAGFDQLLIERHKDWLIETIAARDKINHFLDGGIDFHLFCVSKDLASGSIRVPLWSPDQSIADFMEVIWASLFELCEDFTALFISLKLHPNVGIVRDNILFPEPTFPWKLVRCDQFERTMATRGFQREPFTEPQP